MISSKLYFYLGLISFTFSILFIGVYCHDEFNELNIFTKHRPTNKLYFYSPIGMQPLSIQDLSEDQQKDQLAFNEFIVDAKIQFKGDDTWFVPPLLIQLTLTFLIFGISTIKPSPIQSIFIPFTHALLLFIITGLGITAMAVINNLATITVIPIVLVVANYMTAKILSKKLPTPKSCCY